MQPSPDWRARRSSATQPARPAGSPSLLPCLGRRSIGVLGLEQREGRAQYDVEIEQQRPVFDVVEVVLDALLDLLVRIRLAPPAVDLRPTGDAGFDAVAGEIAVD